MIGAAALFALAAVTTPANPEFVDPTPLRHHRAVADIEIIEVRKNSKLYDVLGWALIGTAATDILSTEYGIHSRGLYEANKLGQIGTAGRVAAKSSMTVAIWWASDRLNRQGSRKSALAMRVITVAVWGYVTAHNLRLVAGQ